MNNFMAFTHTKQTLLSQSFK